MDARSLEKKRECKEQAGFQSFEELMGELKHKYHKEKQVVDC